MKKFCFYVTKWLKQRLLVGVWDVCDNLLFPMCLWRFSVIQDIVLSKVLFFSFQKATVLFLFEEEEKDVLLFIQL